MISIGDGDNSRLRDVLEGKRIDSGESFVVHWIPEQVEDVYHILSKNKKYILIIKINRYSGGFCYEEVDLNKYLNSSMKIVKRKINSLLKYFDN